MADYDVEKAFRRIENDLIASMIRNLSNHRAQETKEGFEWEQWQAKQLAALEEYKKRNAKKYNRQFSSINGTVEELIRQARQQGGMKEEIRILNAIKNGFPGKNASGKTIKTTADFFKKNDRRMDALIDATVNDLKKAEHAMLRMANDKYRKTIFNAQVFANSGAGTYEKAVDMAVKDFIGAGINCVEYKNGARHTVQDYASMAVQTASKRAYLAGEGEKRKEWGLSTVIIYKRGNPCPLCLPFVGKVMIDDVWSGGSSKDSSYPLMSSAISAGLYHPRCKDSHGTYFDGISEPPDDKYSKEELEAIQQENKQEAESQNASRQEERMGRLATFALDPDNKRMYQARAGQWNNKVEEIKSYTPEKIVKTPDSDIIKSKNTKEVAALHSVGKIDKGIYKCITEDIVTDDVIITDERIQHIIERRGKAFYDKYGSHFTEIIQSPDYIFKDNKNTALVCKEFTEDGRVVNIALRLVASTDDPKYKNSIITAVGESDKRFQQRLRNNKPLYKKE